MVCIAICALGTASASIITKYLGISDSIFGIWLGSFNLVLTVATINYLNKKNIKFLFRKPLIFLIYSLFSLYPLYYFNAIDITNKILGIDKIIFGFSLGNLLLGLGYLLNDILIKRNNGKTYFKFQKIIIPLILPLIFSYIFSLLKI